ncbi:MAG: hypothetical protein ACFFG0_43950, partial [Candidatus Thorarchaeota archaeon]
MQLCYLLNESENGRSQLTQQSERQLTQRLEKLKGEGVITDYTTIDELHLGFQFLNPGSEGIYRVDNVIEDLDKVIKEFKKGEIEIKAYGRNWWKKIGDIEELNQLRKTFHDNATAFFRTEDITKWRAELNALNEIDINFCQGDNKK